MASDESGHRSRRLAFGLLVLCTLLRVVSLLRPCLSDDEATYAVIGREMLAGRALYRDVVDHKPPAIYLLNEATQGLGGPTGGMLLLHVLLILLVWATALLLWRIVDRHGGGAGVYAALLWIVFTTTLADFDSLAANCELFMMLPLVASVAVFLNAGKKVASVGMAGVLVGIAMLFKYQAGIQLALYGGAWVLGRRSAARRVAGVAALAIGAALPLLAAVGYLASRGALGAAWFWFRFNFAYIDAGSSGARAVQMLVRVGFVVLGAAPLYLLALSAARRPPREAPRRGFRWFVLGWLAASAFAVSVGGRFFGHYFHQMTAPLAVLAAPAAAKFWARRRAAFALALGVPALVFFVAGLLHNQVMTLYGQPDPDYARVAAWINRHSTPTDAICIWGNSPVLYFDADHPLGCRFVFANYITGLSPATPSQTDPKVDSSRNAVPQAWGMMERDLDTRRPTFVVDASPGNVGYYGKYPPSHFPLGRILACEYTPQATVAGMRIYRRLAVPRCTPGPGSGANSFVPRASSASP